MVVVCAAAYLNADSLGYTVFAPTNEALESTFSALNTTLEELSLSGDLDDILQYHFILLPYTVRLALLGPAADIKACTVSLFVSGWPSDAYVVLSSR